MGGWSASLRRWPVLCGWVAPRRIALRSIWQKFCSRESKSLVRLLGGSSERLHGAQNEFRSCLSNFWSLKVSNDCQMQRSLNSLRHPTYTCMSFFSKAERWNLKVNYKNNFKLRFGICLGMRMLSTPISTSKPKALYEKVFPYISHPLQMAEELERISCESPIIS